MEMNQKSYGNNFIYKEHGAYASKNSARIASIGLILSFLIISTPLKWLIRRFLPQPGEGPSLEVTKQWMV